MLNQNSTGSNQPLPPNANQQQYRQPGNNNPLPVPQGMMNLNKPPVLMPPSQMPNMIANPAVLSQALTKPPALSALMKPPSINSNPSPVLGVRPSPVLNAPPPKSFLSMPKNVLSSQAQPNAMPMSNQSSSKDLNNQSFNNVNLSNNSSVASELNNLTNTSLNQSFGATPQYQQAQNNFFTSSLPASNATNQLFDNVTNQNNQFIYNQPQQQQQQLNTSNDYQLNKSNSTSVSSLNQSLNSSLSTNQNNFLNSSNSNNQLAQSFNNTDKPATAQNVIEKAEETNTNIEDSTQKQNDTDETPKARPVDYQEPEQEIKNNLSESKDSTGLEQRAQETEPSQSQQSFPPQTQQQQPQQQPFAQQPQQQQHFPSQPQQSFPSQPQQSFPSQPQQHQQQQSFPSQPQQSFPSQPQPQPQQQQSFPSQPQQSFSQSQQPFPQQLQQNSHVLPGQQPQTLPPQQPQPYTQQQPQQQNFYQQQPQRQSIPNHPVPFAPFRPMQSTPPPQSSTPTNFYGNPNSQNGGPPTQNLNNYPQQNSNGPPTTQMPPVQQPFYNPQTTQPQISSQPPFQNGSVPSLVRGPPTSAEISQQVRQSGPPPTGPSNQLNNQFNNMSLNNRQQHQPQSHGYPSQPQTQQQHVQNYNQSSAQRNSMQNRSQPASVDLMREKKLIGEYQDLEEPIKPQFPHEFYTNVNCHPDTIRCTLTSIPESQSLLSKCRLPLGILIHPFKDLESLKVVQSSTIVRCRNCRSYINPFVHFIDNSKWRCNMCYSINDLPDEFLFDPVTRSYGDPSKRPEINSSTIEFIAPAEYTLRPPPPAMYLYLLDVSHNAIITGYLQSFCETILENLEKIPGDSRTQIGFITYNSSLHFYNLCDSLSQPRMMIYPDIEDVELPLPDNLMVNLSENKESIQLFLQTLPAMFADTYETDSALGTALNAGFQLLKNTGGRMTCMQTCLPNVGVGALKQRDENVDKDPTNLAPQTDFYKKLALDCAGVHIAVDLFMFNSQYADLATLSCISKYSGGEVKYYPQYHIENHPEQVIRFCVDFKRYLVRKIGFEAVMRIRCTRGLTIHTFHGNFFVRSTDLLALPNVNPDAGFGMQIAIEEALTDTPTVCFQAAVLYTSSKGERRIRIHTYCLPVSKNVNELMNSADQECIIGLVAKMAVDRTIMSSLKEAKDAMINVASDYLQAYTQVVVSGNRQNALISPNSLKLIPLLALALMKNIAFKFGNIRLDERVYNMNLMKTMPLKYLMLCIYPHLYAIHNLDDRVIVDSSETEICIPPRLQLSSENIDRHGVYIMDAGEAIYMWIGRSVNDNFLQLVFDCRSFNELPDHSNDLPELDNILSERVRNFLVYLYDSRPFGPQFIFFREDSSKAKLFFQHMTDDKTESSVSYYEFLRHLQDQMSS